MIYNFVFIIITLLCITSAQYGNANTAKKTIFILIEATNKGAIPIYKSLKTHGHNVKFALLPQWHGIKTHSYATDVLTDKEFMSEVNKDDIIIPCNSKNQCESIEKYKPDYTILFNPYHFGETDPFDNTQLAKFTKILYIPYGPELWDMSLLKNPNLSKVFYKVLADSEMTKRVFMEKHDFKNDQVIISGYTSYQELRSEISKYKKPRNKQETILWSPRWTIEHLARYKGEPGSTFLSYYHFFYNFAKDNPNKKLIIRPHPLLFVKLIESKSMTKSQLNDILSKFKSLPNVEVIDTDKTHTVFKQRDIVEADMIISDTTSLMTNYFVANKPMIYLSNGFDIHFNTPEFQDMAMFMRFARSPNDVLKYIKEIRDNQYQVTQRCVSDKHCYNSNFTHVKQYLMHKFFGDNKIIKHYVEKEKLMNAIDPVENPAEEIANFIDKD